MYEIDPNVLRLDDERIRAFNAGRIDKADLLKLIKHNDPMEFRDGKLVYVSREEQQKRLDQYTVHHREMLKKTGGLHPNAIYENADKFVDVYPEIKDAMDAAIATIKKENCQGCARNKHMGPIMERLLSISSNGRDMSALEEPLRQFPFALKRLKGEEYDVSGVVPPTQGFMKREIPFVRDGEPNAAASPDNPMGIVRDSCMDCVRKHLARAYVLMTEALQGYTTDRGHINESMMIAHLDEAAEEALKENPDLAARIRKFRTSLMGQTKNV